MFFSNKAKNQSLSFSQTRIAMSLNPQNLWLLLNRKFHFLKLISSKQALDY
ncbi:hypothetical protein NEOC65_001684 [Neochlamydia sp. AcF65]|nr:hypothetical protein [Neochlamydia sp. AcF65]NGY95495.1 hypothetical protein [Neochlamydia sp. AcF84]